MKINKDILNNLEKSSFKNENINYYLGLDLGISSVGWAIMAEDKKTRKHYLHDFGVRIFDISEDGKTGESHNQKRRSFRGQRRIIRRKVYRIQRIKNILEKINFLTEKEFQKAFNQVKSTNKIIETKDDNFTTEKGYWNAFVLRNKGLEQKLDRWEIYSILIHFCKKRGYLDKSLVQEQEGTKESSKNSNKKKTPFESAIEKAETLTNEKYISRIILKHPEFRIKEGKEILLYCKNGFYGKNKEEKLNYRFLFARNAYEKELNKILETQVKYYPELKKAKEEIKEIIFYQRDFEKGPKCKNHHKGNCNENACSKWKTFLETVGKCPYEIKEKRGFKSSLLFDIYLFIVEINKFLRLLAKKELNFKESFYQELLSNFIVNNWSKTEIKKYIMSTETWKKNGEKAYFSNDIWKSDKNGMNLRNSLFLKKISKIPAFKKQIKKINFKNKDWIEELENNWISQIGKTVYENITRKRRKEKLIKILEVNNIKIEEKDLKILVDLESKVVTAAKVSFKHMKNVIKDFWNGKNIAQEMWTRQKELDLYKNNLNGLNKNNSKKIFSKLVDWDLQRNPVVFRAINQTRKILQALHWKYGEFKNINIELARDMAKSFQDRQKIQKKQLNNANNNEKIKEELDKEGIRNNFTNLLSFKLWKDQLEECIYCGIKIPKTLIGRGTEINIDHIVPFSQLADDSYENKVLTHTTCNQTKGQKTPLEYFGDGEEKRKFLARVLNLKSKRKITWKKYNYLNTAKASEIDDFVSRNLNDTRWITKYILGYVKSQLEYFDMKKTKVLAVPGGVNSRLRRKWLKGSGWGLDKKVRDISPFHHAIDAMVVAQIKSQWELELASDLVTLQKQKDEYSREQKNYWKEIKHEKYKTFLKTTKKKWKIREEEYKLKTDYSKIIEDLEKNEHFNQPLYIKDLRKQIELRIPVKLKTEFCKCENKKQKEGKILCLKCLGKKEIPVFNKILNEEEWKKEINRISKAENINLRYPVISYMTNYKIKSDWSSSENYGFTGKNKKEKTKLYKIWKEDPELKKEENKKLSKNAHWKEWKKQFQNNEGFIFNEKTGNIIETDAYYGVVLKKEEKEKANWIRLVDLNLKNKRNDIFKKINKKNLVIKGVNILYFDEKSKKELIKTFRGKRGSQIGIHPNHLNFIANHEKNQKTFHGWLNYYDQINNLNKKFKLIKIDILGNILN